MKSAGKTGVIGTIAIAIWAIPGVGILPLLVFLQHRKSGKDRPATGQNERGQYG